MVPALRRMAVGSSRGALLGVLAGPALGAGAGALCMVSLFLVDWTQPVGSSLSWSVLPGAFVVMLIAALIGASIGLIPGLLIGSLVGIVTGLLRGGRTSAVVSAGLGAVLGPLFLWFVPVLCVPALIIGALGALGVSLGVARTTCRFRSGGA
jgi:hypothetical protein